MERNFHNISRIGNEASDPSTSESRENFLMKGDFAGWNIVTDLESERKRRKRR